MASQLKRWFNFQSTLLKYNVKSRCGANFIKVCSRGCLNQSKARIQKCYVWPFIASASVVAVIGYYKVRLSKCEIYFPLALSVACVENQREVEINEERAMRNLKLNHRERRFIKFASVEYDGQCYMTPQDFIESVTNSEPRSRLKTLVLTKKELERFYQETPPLTKGSPAMFRTIYEKGIISYTEYLFLLSILTKPQTGFRIAFNMFDTDGNQKVDKAEFLKLETIFSTARRGRLSRAKESIRGVNDDNDTFEEFDDELQKKHNVDTTLLVHFFGIKGNQTLTYEDFKMFMENLQTEVLEIEFSEFSKGLPTISEVDFAKILLRYTYLPPDQYAAILDRLRSRLPEERGITFLEFKSFCQFLNTLDDFAIAMRMYTLAEHPISQDEFHRAVKICINSELSKHIVDTVFKIFDEDGDDHLSYKEFIAIMRDRLHRGFKHTSRSEGWEAFKHCLKSEMRAVN